MRERGLSLEHGSRQTLSGRAVILALPAGIITVDLAVPIHRTSLVPDVAVHFTAD